MITLNDNDIDIINHTGYSKSITLSCGTFYIKKLPTFEGIMELTGEVIARDLGLICPHNYLVTVLDESYLLSEDLNTLGEFTPAGLLDENLYEASLYDAWHVLESKYGSVQNELKDLLKIYMFDVLFANFDRNSNNWGILTLKNNERRIVMLDNEYMLGKIDYLRLSVLPNNDEVNIIDDFKVFLSESSSEFIDEFNNLINKYTPEYFSSLITKVIEENKIDINMEVIDMYLDYYEIHYYNLLEILKNTKKRGV